MQGTRLVDRVRLGSGAGGALAPQILERDRRERQIRATGPFPASDDRPDRAGRRAISLQIRPLGRGVALHESALGTWQTYRGEFAHVRFRSEADMHRDVSTASVADDRTPDMEVCWVSLSERIRFQRWPTSRRRVLVQGGQHCESSNSYSVGEVEQNDHQSARKGESQALTGHGHSQDWNEMPGHRSCG